MIRVSARRVCAEGIECLLEATAFVTTPRIPQANAEEEGVDCFTRPTVIRSVTVPSVNFLFLGRATLVTNFLLEVIYRVIVY